MKIRRFVARDMKTALAQIKEELGSEAVIMSNKKIAEGVELMAAVDYAQSASSAESSAPQDTDKTKSNKAVNALDNDVVSLSQSAPIVERNAAVSANGVATQSPPTTITKPSINEANQPVDSLSALLNRKIQHSATSETLSESPTPSMPVSPEVSVDIEQQFKEFTERLEQSSSEAMYESSDMLTDVENSWGTSGFDIPLKNDTTNTSPSTNIKGSASQSTLTEIEYMKQEMASMRQLLEHQVSGLLWQDMAQREPSRAYLVNRLMDMGLTEQVADQISGYIPTQYNEEESWEHAKKLMSQQLNTTQNEIVHRGGIFSLVGPTGVGKTTTIAKLAARFAQIHGADQVVLISTDNYRIAGFEQLVTYGRIIGCQVKQAHDIQVLDTLLQQFSNKKLILIDTAGMGQRDMRLVKHLTTLVSNARVRIRNYLVLSANTQQKVMQENVERFKAIPLSGCIFTKLDESVSAGEIIATSIQNALPIGYLTDGQRVPEDIKVANTEKLVTLADAMAKKYNPSQSMVKQSRSSMQTALA